jgi:hypothetical protein
LLVWRKADNWTAFTDGYRTWLNGPQGLQQRLNTELFPWEAAPAAGRTVVWAADMEPGDFSQWEADGGGGLFNTGTGQASVTTAFAHGGARAAQLTITTGDGASHAARLFRWSEARANPAAYYGAWYYFPHRYAGMAWWNVFQWKSKTPTRNDAFWQLNVGNRPDGSMYLYLYNWVNARAYDQAAADLPVGRWVHLEAYYVQSSTGAGRVVVWQDGAKLWDLVGADTQYPDGDVEWSLNDYTDGISPAVATIYVDDAAISTGPAPP